MYFLKNKFSHIRTSYKIDSYVPLTIRVEGNSAHSDTETYIRYRLSNVFEDLTEVKIGVERGELDHITVVFCSFIKIYDYEFCAEDFISVGSTVALALDRKGDIPSSSDGISSTTIKKAAQLELYQNTLILKLPSSDASKYIFCHDVRLSLLTDKNFNVTGFVIWNPTEDEKKILVNYAKERNVDVSPEPKVEKKIERKVGMKNQQCLFKKILDLKNVNVSELFYFGLEKSLIESDFVIDFALSKIEQNKSDQKSPWLEIAGLLKKERDKVSDLIEQSIQDKSAVTTTKGPFYNKIWFYLTLAADMCEDKIID